MASSRFNTLYLGEPEAVVNLLDFIPDTLEKSEVVAALANAFRRIARLEEDVSELKAERRARGERSASQSVPDHTQSGPPDSSWKKRREP
jgi:hypothetical protein